MRELMRSNDLVRISWIEALLADAGVETVVLDAHMSVLEGSLGILPRRVMVQDGDYARAVKVLKDAAEDHDMVRQDEEGPFSWR